ncbi:5-carboxymethyl-2-hydroxymuconate Delta-isomerase [Kribbella sp. CA-293567]|uniref:5-carboxymethyl-2-hydroxymuconate Delta-isomerase n=1 Tax=Kribbella sp. CA-293567 TaxID=3002436 RepID=UPI0022DE708B|nr:5-carboxymethyl-2-hydroxymuconate Delta-isomerase [Kribbella sp. CA-293567]WBQ04429.1 5-carboxymethyl-2-hydroxymuconate Delta-isomerase [Kribbella sp. CA-293567]
MPHITVEYSESLSGAFDRRAFALALHRAAAELIDSAIPGFKTRFRPIDEGVIADGGDGEAMIHVELAILPGRDQDTKSRLGDLTLATLGEYLDPAAGSNTQLTVEVRDLATYVKRVMRPGATEPH